MKPCLKLESSDTETETKNERFFYFFFLPKRFYNRFCNLTEEQSVFSPVTHLKTKQKTSMLNVRKKPKVLVLCSRLPHIRNC